MPAPAITFFHDDSSPETGTPVDAINPIDFGTVEKGITSDVITIHVWNDKDGSEGSDTAVAPRFYAVNDPDDISGVFAGTTLNNFQSMLEARSCGSYGTPADQHQAWTPIGPGDYLVLGDMPSGSMREIEIRLAVPVDATAHGEVQDFQFRVSL